MPYTEKWRHKFQIKPNSWVFVPTDDAIEYGKKIKKSIESCWSSPSYYYHLRDGGHVKALYSHVCNTYFAHLDIKDFFGSINKSRVTRCLKGYFPYEEARKIAINSTVRLPDSNPVKHILPFGFVQSPILASVCLRKSALGRVLHRLHKSKDIIVSLYMDDIIISGNNKEDLNESIQHIRESADRSRFDLNQDKEEGPAKKVTAFNIELSKQILEITSERMNKFATSFVTANSQHQREGILGYISSVNDVQAEYLLLKK